MKIVIVVRSNADWLNMTKDKFFNQNTHFGDDREKYFKYISAWDSKFNVSFFKFRHNIKLLSQETWANMESVDYILKDVYSAPEIIDKISDDFIILPTDDDDWYCPNLISKIKNISNTPSVKWSMSACGILNNKISIKRPGYNTNSFAIFKNCWDNLPSEKKNSILTRHSNAGKILKKMNQQSISDCLSTWNRTLASLSSSKNLEVAIKDMRKRAIIGTSRKIIPSKSEWMRPYVRRMRKLYEELL